MTETPPAALWSSAGPFEPLGGGNRNTVLRTVGPGPSLVFKTTRRAPDALAWLTTAQDAAEAAGFLVPRLIASRSGNLVENGWTCEPFIEGRAVNTAALLAIDAAIRQFHILSEGLPQRPGFLSSRMLLEAERGGDIDLRSMPPVLAERCRRAWSALPDGRETVIHGDLNPANLLLCRDDRFALLDWDECRKDAPEFDTGHTCPSTAVTGKAVLAWEIAVCWSIEPERARRLVARL